VSNYEPEANDLPRRVGTVQADLVLQGPFAERGEIPPFRVHAGFDLGERRFHHLGLADNGGGEGLPALAGRADG
jgi:hypothetical protein